MITGGPAVRPNSISIKPMNTLRSHVWCSMVLYIPTLTFIDQSSLLLNGAKIAEIFERLGAVFLTEAGGVLQRILNAAKLLLSPRLYLVYLHQYL